MRRWTKRGSNWIRSKTSLRTRPTNRSVPNREPVCWHHKWRISKLKRCRLVYLDCYPLRITSEVVKKMLCWNYLVKTLKNTIKNRIIRKKLWKPLCQASRFLNLWTLIDFKKVCDNLEHQNIWIVLFWTGNSSLRHLLTEELYRPVWLSASPNSLSPNISFTGSNSS